MFDDQEQAESEQFDNDVLKWLARDYVSTELWKSKAREVYYGSNGDGDLARQRLASMVRCYFVDHKAEAEEISRWAGKVQEKITVVPPKVTAVNAGHYDWLYVADYFLLCCGSPSEEYQEEVQRRENDYQQLLNSYNLRMQVIAARKAIQQSPDSDDATLLALVKEAHPKASLANVKEARRMESKGLKLLLPIEPKRAAYLPLYKAVYF